MKFKSILGVVLAMAVILSFAACGSNDQAEDGQGEHTTSVESGDLAEYLVTKNCVTYNADGTVYQGITVEQNDAGLPVKTTVEGRDQGVVTYTYDCNALTTVEYQKDDGNRICYEFNEFGYEIKREEYEDNTLTAVTSFQYDATGRLTEKQYEEPDNEKANKVIAYTYTLDDRGNVVKEVQFVNGQEYFITEIEYDDAGREIKYTGAYVGAEPYIRTSEYNDSGLIIKSTEYTGEVEDCYTEYFYDEKGNEIRNVTMKNGEEDAYEESEYDDRGNLVKFTYYESAMGQRHYEYEYDENNNMVADRYYIGDELERYTNYTWHTKTINTTKTMATAIKKAIVILEEK